MAYTTTPYIHTYTKEQEREFIRLINKHMGVVHCVLRSWSDYFLPHEYEDYKQEILYQAWKTFHKFEERYDGTDFGTWLYTTSRWAIISSRRTAVNRQNAGFKIIYTEDLPEIYKGYSEDFLQDHINSMYCAIASLSDLEQDIIALHLQEKDFVEVAADLGLNHKYVQNKFHKAKEKIRKRKNLFFPRTLQMTFEKRKLKEAC